MPIEQEIKQEKPLASTYQRLIVNLIFTGAWTKDIANKYLKQFDLSNEQYNILRILRGSYPKLMTISDIQSRMVDRTSNVGRMIDKLLEKKYLDRTTNPNNRRESNVVITQNGLDFLAEIDVEFYKIEERMKSLSVEETNQLIDLLDKLRG
jgi:DNA-binding MarR family transcriptional regulator